MMFTKCNLRGEYYDKVIYGSYGPEKIIVAVVVAVVVLASSSFVPRAEGATELLPNLVALPAEEIFISTENNVTSLKFSAGSWNRGTGPLELHGGGKLRKVGRQQVYQRIFSDDATYRDVLAGTFTYHSGHKHFHFDDFAIYSLQPVNAPGGSDRISSKTTFCIADVRQIDLTLPGAPASRVYGATCNSQIQGMSVGWADMYYWTMEGQAIDITGLPDGDYNLKVEVDPKLRIIESDESDNVSNVLLRISAGRVTRL